jgi:hypothetical protein
MTPPETHLVDKPIGGVWLEVLAMLYIRCRIGGFPEGFDLFEAEGHLRTLHQSHINAMEEETQGNAAAHRQSDHTATGESSRVPRRIRA